jgi:sugar/nucleoside kinase (ribokinase family)
MILVLGDLVADLALRIPSFPITSSQLQRVEYLALGPGGAANVAIMAARLGLPVSCLAEVGKDRFGEIILEGLRAEGIDASGVVVSPDGETPVAGVNRRSSRRARLPGLPGEAEHPRPP